MIHKLFIQAFVVLFVAAVHQQSTNAQYFSHNAKAGMHCDHDKVRVAFKNSKFTSTHTIDTSNQEVPFVLQPYLYDIECPSVGLESSECGKCNSSATAIGSSTMKTFAKYNETSVCEQEDILTSAKQTYIMDLVNDAAAILKDIIVAPDFVGGLTANPASGTRCGADSAHGNTAGGLLLPTAHLTAQPGVHFMLYITAGPPSPSLIAKRNRSATDTSPEPLAWGATCGYTQSGDLRPIVGHLHFAPRAIDADPAATTSDSKRSKDLYFVLHQIMHMLGWSLPLLPQGYTSTYLATAKDTYSSTTVAARSWAFEYRNAVSSPAVLSETKNFFGCQSSLLVGAEFGELQGDSHLTKRIFADDFMSEPLPWDPVPYVSRHSFALLEDSGFWKINYTNIDAKYNTSQFGKQRGCRFVNAQCRSTSSSVAEWDEFCWSTTDEQCGVDLLSGGPCDIMVHDEAPSAGSISGCVPTDEASYFSDNCKKGGPRVSDYCPTPARVTSFSQCNDLSNNKDPNGAYRLGSAYSKTSRCIQGTVARVGAEPRTPFLETRCVELVCAWDTTVSPSRKSLFVKLFNDSLTIACPVDGGQIDIGLYSTNYSGFYVCPPYSDSFCTSKNLEDAGSISSVSSKIVNETLLSGEDYCSSRVDCAVKAYDDFVASTSADSCSKLSRTIRNCFLGQCAADKSKFLRSKLDQNCTVGDENFKKLVAVVCSDGIDGAMDLCDAVISSSSAGKVLFSSVIFIIAVMTLLI